MDKWITHQTEELPLDEASWVLVIIDPNQQYLYGYQIG